MAVEDPEFSQGGNANLLFGKLFNLTLHRNEKELEPPGSATEL